MIEPAGPLRGKQLPVVGIALRMADARVPRDGQRREIALIADETARQHARAIVVEGRVRHALHHAARRRALVACARIVDARAADHARHVARVPRQLAEHACVPHRRLRIPRLVAVVLPPHRRARVEPVRLRIDARHELEVVGKTERRGRARERAPPHFRRHPHRHAAGRVRLPQRSVVHHVIGFVVVHARFDPVEHVTEMLLVERQAERLAAEMRAVHSASRVARIAVAGAGGQLDACMVVRRPAERRIGVPLVPLRRHGVAVAVLVVLRMRVVRGHTAIDVRRAGRHVDVLVVAAERPADQAAVEAHAGLVEARRHALEHHGAGRRAGTVQHGLRPLHDGDLVIAFRRDIRRRRVHPARTCAERRHPVRQDVQPRAEHPAQHEVAVGAAAADRRETGDRFQVIRAVAGGQRLTRRLRIRDDDERRRQRRCNNFDGRQRRGVSPVGAPDARAVSAAAALAANAPTASAGTVSFSTRGMRRAPALRDARGVRNWKMVMIESPSDALHAASTGRTDIGDEWNGNSASGALGRRAGMRADSGARRDGDATAETETTGMEASAAAAGAPIAGLCAKKPQ